MTNPELKVSEKVRELAEDLNGEGLLVGDSYGGLTSSRSKDKAASQIQSSLRELLDAGREFTQMRTNLYNDDFTRLQKFAAILSKWEPPR